MTRFDPETSPMAPIATPAGGEAVETCPRTDAWSGASMRGWTRLSMRLSTCLSTRASTQVQARHAGQRRDRPGRFRGPVGVGKRAEHDRIGLDRAEHEMGGKLRRRIEVIPHEPERLAAMPRTTPPSQPG